MVLKSSYREIYFSLVTYPLAYVVLLVVIAMMNATSKEPREFKEIIALVCLGLCILFGILINWIAFGREIELTEEGCIVRFLGYSKLYLWNQMKTKKRIPIYIQGMRFENALIYDSLLLSYRKVWIRKHNHLGRPYKYIVPTIHPFSLIFISFRPKKAHLSSYEKKLEQAIESHNPPGFYADEEQILALLQRWGVTLDD